MGTDGEERRAMVVTRKYQPSLGAASLPRHNSPLPTVLLTRRPALGTAKQLSSSLSCSSCLDLHGTRWPPFLSCSVVPAPAAAVASRRPGPWPAAVAAAAWRRPAFALGRGRRPALLGGLLLLGLLSGSRLVLSGPFGRLQPRPFPAGPSERRQLWPCHPASSARRLPSPCPPGRFAQQRLSPCPAATSGQWQSWPCPAGPSEPRQLSPCRPFAPSAGAPSAFPAPPFARQRLPGGPFGRLQLWPCPAVPVARRRLSALSCCAFCAAAAFTLSRAFSAFCAAASALSCWAMRARSRRAWAAASSLCSRAARIRCELTLVGGGLGAFLGGGFAQVAQVFGAGLAVAVDVGQRLAALGLAAVGDGGVVAPAAAAAVPVVVALAAPGVVVVAAVPAAVRPRVELAVLPVEGLRAVPVVVPAAVIVVVVVVLEELLDEECGAEGHGARHQRVGAAGSDDGAM